MFSDSEEEDFKKKQPDNITEEKKGRSQVGHLAFYVYSNTFMWSNLQNCMPLFWAL